MQSAISGSTSASSPAGKPIYCRGGRRLPVRGRASRFLARVAFLGGTAADGGGGVGADRRRPRRAGAAGAPHSPQRLPIAELVDGAGEIELAISKIRRGSYFPSFLKP